MNKSVALETVKPHLTHARYLHTERVTETALYLAKIYEVDEMKVMLASVFHDYCKHRPLKEMRTVIEKTPTLNNHLLDYHHELWHGPVASVLLKEEQNIFCPDILSAIHWHTTGRAKMTKLEKVVFLADYIEPGRSFAGLDEVRSKAVIDLDEAVYLVIKKTINYLISRSKKVYPDALALYNDLST